MVVIEEKRTYFTVPFEDELDHLGLRITRVGTTRTLPEYRKVSIGAGDHTLLFVRTGKGFVESGGRLTDFSAGDVVVMQQGIRCEWWSDPKAPLAHYWIGIAGAGCPGILRRLGVAQEVQVLRREALPPAELEAFESMIRLLRTRPPHFLWKLYALFFDLCRSVASTTATTSPEGRDRVDPELIKRFIEANYAEPISVGEIAKTFGMTPNFLSQYFRQSFGLTPYAYLVSVRMERARELLKEGRSVKETSLSVGYADPNYFSRLFRKKTGCPPSAVAESASGPMEPDSRNMEPPNGLANEAHEDAEPRNETSRESKWTKDLEHVTS